VTHAASLRSRLAGGESILMPGVWDPLSALLAERAGFHTVFVSGFAVAGTLLGEPDIGIVDQANMADVARRVCAAAPNLCVVVDADTGYGDTRDVQITTELWESAGAGGMFLEDQVWPKKCGHMDGKQVVPADEWLAKLTTVIHARSDIFVTARTDARAVNGLTDALERGRMARDLGVDAVFVEAPQSLSELDDIAAALPDVVLVANMVEKGKTPLLTPSELTDRGFTLVVSPLSGLLSATKALADAYSRLQSFGTLRDHLGTITAFDEFTDIVGLPKHLANDAEQR